MVCSVRDILGYMIHLINNGSPPYKWSQTKPFAAWRLYRIFVYIKNGQYVISSPCLRMINGGLDAKEAFPNTFASRLRSLTVRSVRMGKYVDYGIFRLWWRKSLIWDGEFRIEWTVIVMEEFKTRRRRSICKCGSYRENGCSYLIRKIFNAFVKYMEAFLEALKKCCATRFSLFSANTMLILCSGGLSIPSTARCGLTVLWVGCGISPIRQ